MRGLLPDKQGKARARLKGKGRGTSEVLAWQSTFTNIFYAAVKLDAPPFFTLFGLCRSVSRRTFFARHPDRMGGRRLCDGDAS